MNLAALARAGTPVNLSAADQDVLNVMRDNGAVTWGQSLTGVGLYGLVKGAKAVLMKGAQAAAQTVRSMAPVREAESLAAVKKLGMKVHELDVSPLQEGAVAAQNELAKEFDAESLLAQIRKQ